MTYRGVVATATALLFVASFSARAAIVNWTNSVSGGWDAAIQGQTNPVAVGLTTNWVTIPGSGLANQIILPIDKANGSVFFRMIYP